MNRNSIKRRRSPPGFIWLFLGLALVVVVGLIAIIPIAGQWARQLQRLQTEVAALQGERKTMEAQLIALQGTAAAMESRLATEEANGSVQQPVDCSQEMAILQASLAEIQARVRSLQATVDGLSASSAPSESISGSEARETLLPQVGLAVARQRQTHNLSCESSAAAMVAQYHGVPLSEADVLAALPLNDDPYLGFRGSVDGPTGGFEDYGVYAGPITAILNSRGLRAWPVEGGLDGIKAAIARGNPVIAWVTYNCLSSTPTTVTIDGKAVTLVAYQHAVVVTGYNAEGVWANDPWDGQEDLYPVADFERAMGYFGNMAIEVAGP